MHDTRSRFAMLKRCCVVSSLLTLLVASTAFAADRRTDRSHLVLMTFNAEFLWDGVAPEEGQADFPWKGSQTEAEEHMRDVAGVIIRNDPDVINLVEVESLEALKTFNDKFLPGRGYVPYLVKGTDTVTGQDVALLTRIDPDGGNIARDERAGVDGEIRKTVSKNYYATIDAGGGLKVLLVGIHFLAFPNREDRAAQRQAQADAILGVIRDRRCSGCEVVLWGDFNDYDGNPDSADHIDSAPVSAVLKVLREREAGAADDLVNAASFLAKATRFTAHYDRNDNGRADPPNEFTAIDHVLLSSGLSSKIESVDIDHTHQPPAVSDHFPIVVRLRTGDSSQAGALRIVGLLPNPAGDESQNEEVVLRNPTAQSVSLAGWKLRDAAGATWGLTGSIAAGKDQVIKRAKQPMAMNNTGDTVDLVDAAGNVIHSVSYGRVDEDERLAF